MGGFLGWWVLRAMRIYYIAGGVMGALIERILWEALGIGGTVAGSWAMLVTGWCCSQLAYAIWE